MHIVCAHQCFLWFKPRGHHCVTWRTAQANTLLCSVGLGQHCDQAGWLPLLWTLPPFLLFLPVASPAIPLLDGPAHPLGYGVSSVISLGAKGLDRQRCREQTATTLDLQDAYCL